VALVVLAVLVGSSGAASARASVSIMDVECTNADAADVDSSVDSSGIDVDKVLDVKVDVDVGVDVVVVDVVVVDVCSLAGKL
jgi:hypothetical protein